MTNPSLPISVPSERARQPSAQVAFVLKGYPRLSETFIAQELLALQQYGLQFVIVAMRRPTDRAVHPVHQAIRAPLSYLPEYLHREPRRVLAAWWRQRRRPGYPKARRRFLRELIGDRSRHRIRRFGQALVLADELPHSVERLHVHFLHAPATMTEYAAEICGLPWSCSAHAKDIWTQRAAEIRAKLLSCDWLVTCTAANHAYLQTLARHPEQVELVYHGLDFDRFPAPPTRASGADGSGPEQTVRLLSVGRAVAKKGFADLLEALARLDPALHWRWTHIGGGEQLEALQQQARRLGLTRRIDWLGALTQTAVLHAYRNADLFVLPCRIEADGDRDGLPNVLMEAQSQGLACVATDISGIPELIEDQVCGRTLRAGDIHALSTTLAQMITDPGERRRLAEAGFERVRKDFSMHQGVRRLAAKFGLPVRSLG